MLHPSCMYLDVFVYIPSNLKHCVPAIAAKSYWCVVHYLIKACITSYLVLLHRTQFYYVELRSTAAFALASYLYKYISCTSFFLRYLVQFSHSFHSTTCWEVTATCGPACNIARSLVHVTSELLGPTCPLLGHTPSIYRGAINDADFPSGIRSSLFYILYYP